MRYRIGEVAALFGLTKEGVRYYERKGILHAEREGASGARTYDNWEVTRLKQISVYKKLGFSLEEANDMVRTLTCEEAETVITQKIVELEVRERLLKENLMQLKEQRQAMHAFLTGEICVKTVPESWFMPRILGEETPNTALGKKKINRMLEVGHAWTEAMPSVRLSARHYNCKMEPARDRFGSSVTCEVAERLGLPTDGAYRLPSRPCIVGYAHAPLGEAPYMEKMIAYMREHGYHLVDDVYGILCMVYCDDTGKRWGIHEMVLPIAKD